MSITFSKIKNIHQRNKDLIFGFCRQNESKYNHQVYPKIVNYLCLMYLIFIKDEFDQSKNINTPSIQFTKNEIVGQENEESIMPHFIEGINECTHGIHKWYFKFIQIGIGDCLGVRSKDINHLFQIRDGKFCKFSNDFICKNGDEVELTLNCYNQTLMIKKTDETEYEETIVWGTKAKLVWSVVTFNECHYKLLKYTNIF